MTMLLVYMNQKSCWRNWSNNREKIESKIMKSSQRACSWIQMIVLWIYPDRLLQVLLEDPRSHKLRRGMTRHLMAHESKIIHEPQSVSFWVTAASAAFIARSNPTNSSLVSSSPTLTLIKSASTPYCAAQSSSL